MSKQIESFNTRRERLRTTRSLYLPSSDETLLYLVLAFGLLCLVNIVNIWHYFNQTYVGQNEGFSSVLNQNTPFLSKISNAFSGGPLLQFLFWFVIGSACYVLYWFIKTIAINFRDDIVVEKYYLDRASAKRRFLLSAITRRVFFVAATLALIVYVLLAVRAFVKLGNIFYDSLFVNFDAKHWLLVVGPILLSFLLLHFFIVSLRLAAISWRSANPF
jgi:hypothetical protein